MGTNLKSVKVTYFYFIDLFDENSADYNKIVSLKADDIDNAWEELLKRHINRYNMNLTIEQIKEVYKFNEKKEIL